MQHVLLPALLSFPSLRRNSSSCAKRSLFNPVFSLPGRVRDPAVRLNEAGEAELFFTYFRGNPAAMFTSAGAKDYYVSRVVTRDWQTFSEPSDITPPGFASPDAPIRWDNATIIAFQAYPDKSLGGKSSGLFFSRRDDGSEIWSEPRPFLREALTLPWNTGGRAIDPTLVLDSDGRLHCFFVGSTKRQRGDRRRANLLGQAVSTDPDLQRWEVLSREAPLIGTSSRAPDGVENVAVFRRRSDAVMIYSEGLKSQHLAHAVSKDDLISWQRRGALSVGEARWTAGRYGAPFVWAEGDCWWMALMGEAETQTHQSAIGLLHSSDGVHWQLLPEAAGVEMGLPLRRSGVARRGGDGADGEREAEG